MKGTRRVRMVAALIATLIFASVESPSASAAPQMVEMAQGGPYIASHMSVEKFGGSFTINESDLDRPMTVVIHNGINGTPGFYWLRVFLAGDIDVSRLQHFEDPVGDLLLDDNNVQRHTVSMDVSGQVQLGVNTIVIEGKGPKGATISWTLDGQVAPAVSALNPTNVQQGSRLLLYGSGFNPNASDNVVTFGGNEAEVLDSSHTTLTVKVPAHLPSGQHDVKVSSHGMWSQPYSMAVESTPKLYSVAPRAPGALDVVVVKGANFSPAVEGNEVYFNSLKAKVVSASPEELVVAVPPEVVVFGVNQTVRVSVSVDGVPAGAVYFGK